MTLPRCVLPGTTYLITRRTSQREYRLRPSTLTNGVYLYALARAAERTGVRVHAVCVMSTHHHLVVTDVEGRLPEFLAELHRVLAKCLNAAQGAWERFWNGDSTNVVRLATDDDVLRKMAYTILNPVAAGAVARPEDWPGVLLHGEQTLVVKRPTTYFNPRGQQPGECTLLIVPPPSVTGNAWDVGDEEGGELGEGAGLVVPSAAGAAEAAGAAPPPARWRQRLAHLVAEGIAEARAALPAGHKVLGRAAVAATPTTQRATTWEAKRELVPTVAAMNAKVRVALLRARARFLAAYHSALEAWKHGARDVVFPAGTWWLRVHHGATVAVPLALGRAGPA